MVLTFLKLAFRKIWLEKSFSTLSITGLSLATVACTIILIYVSFERSYDDFRSSDVYRVTHHGFKDNVEIGSSAQVVPALAPAIKQDIPEVINSVRLVHTAPFMADPVMQYGDKNFRESKIYFAEDGFLSMFSYKIISGSVEKALSRPDQVAVARSVAEKYFGTEDPIGKPLTFHRGEQGAKELLVTAVFEDVPANSHLHTDFLISFSTLDFKLDQDWDWGNFYTYIQVKPGIANDVVESKIPALLNKHIGKFISESAGQGYTTTFLLQPIQAIHLESNLWGELETNGDLRTVNFLNLIAIFILAIAWINYINFSIARSSGQSKEISVRKISGSSRLLLIAQFLTDSALINALAAAISAAIIQVTLPLLKAVIGLPDAVSFGWENVLTLFLIFLAGTICSGLYPAIFISRLNPVLLLKSRISKSSVSLRLNKVLIVFQFTASVVLIAGTITVFQQLTFMRDKELGLDIERTVVVKGPAVKDSTYLSNLSFFGSEVKKLSGISSFAVSSSIPGEELQWGRSFARMDDPQNSIGCAIVAIDENFFDLFDAPFAAGKNYPDASTAYRDGIIINESAARAIGYRESGNAIAQTIIWNEGDNQFQKTVIGVVKDFNQQSLRKKVEPIVFTLKKYVDAPWAGEFYTFKIKGADLHASIDGVQKIWKEVYPANPFDYFFLDEFFDHQYKRDEQFGKVFSLFSGLAIFIASLGLFGLTAYMTSLRTKEIGIRKVLGSSTFQLIRLLSGSYLVMVLIAFVIACPIAFYLMSEWLSQFAFRIDLTAWIFITAGMLALLSAMLTVGLKSWNVSQMNPSKALKYE